MFVKQAAKLFARGLLILSCWTTFAASGQSLSTNAPIPPANTNRSQTSRRRPDQLPVTRIASLTRELAKAQSNQLVRVQGVVLDQGLGEYVIVQDETGSIRAETRQTNPLGGGEGVTAWGMLSWNGHNAILRNANVLPLSWNSISVTRVAPALGKPDELPTLTQVRQIKDLPPEQAAWRYPVRIRGVITTIMRDWQGLFAQDDTAGIYVVASKLNPDTNWNVGDEVVLEGVSGPGGYAPIIEAERATIAGEGKLPAARLVTLYQMATGQFDAQWVEVRGVIRSVHVSRRSTEIQLSDINGIVEVDVPGGDAFTNLVDSLVRIRGVCGSRANPNRQLTGAYIWSPLTNLLVVEEKGVTDPFSLATDSIASLSRFTQARAIQHRVKIAGVVTFSQLGLPLFVQDNTGGVPVYLAEPGDFHPGDSVEIAGYLSPGDFGYVFRNASGRRIGRGQVPVPRPIVAPQWLNQNLHGMWVQLSARLVSSSRRATEDVLTLQTENSLFEALRPHGHENPEASLPPIGSRVMFKGVYSIVGDESRKPRALRVYIPPAQPIQLLEKPSWWNSRRASTALGIVVACLVAAALWGITLRRRIAKQTLVIGERLAKEAALEQRYREMFEAANDLIFTFDIDGRVTSLNPAGQRLLGYSAAEVKQLKIEDLLAPASRGLTRHLLEAKTANGTEATCECELVTRDGRSILVETSARLMFKDGKVSSVQAISRDIAARKQAEEALRESEAHYRQLVEMSPNAIFIQSEGRFAFINQAGLQLFGASNPEEILGRRILDLLHPDYHEIVLQRMAVLQNKREAVPLLEEKYLRLDGSVVDVEVAAASIVFEGKAAAQVIIHDISQRKRAEEDLFNSQQMLRLVLDTIPQRVFWKDRNSVYVGCNKSLAQDSGCAHPNELIGKTDYEMDWRANADLYRADDRQVMDSGQPKLSYEEPQVKPDGRATWVKTSKVPLHDKNGHVIGVLCTYEDITERKRAEAALAEASALLDTLLHHIPDCIYFKDRQSRFVRFSKSFEKLFKMDDSLDLRGKTDFDFFTEEHARPAYQDEQEIIRSGQPIIGKLEKETHPDGRVTWALTTKMPWRDKDGNTVGTFGVSKDVTSIKEAQAELAYERELFRALLDSLPDNIYFKDRESRFVRVSRAKAEMTFDLVRARHFANSPSDGQKTVPEHLASIEAFASYLIGKSDKDTFEPELAEAAREEEQTIIRTGKPVIGKVEHQAYRGKWMLVTKMPWRDKDDNIIGTFGVSRDITAVKEAEAKLQAAHERLVETSRLAGMAEVATDVLHNVGNVLNSVNVSCSLTLDRIRTSKVSSLSKVSALLQENRQRLPEFLTQDARGQQIPEFVAALAEHLKSEQSLLVNELQHLVTHIDHIKQIVAMQQTYAKVAGVLEVISPVQLVEDALHINAAALLRHEVNVRREYQEAPQILTEKHRVLQILVNLIRNAKYAMDDTKRTDKLLTVKVASDEKGQVRIQIVDNGVGIPHENLTRIFSHGFTTRRNGHGFGLHSSALAVRELGGSIHAQSEGTGSGATFTLLLPPAPPKHPQETV